MFFSDYDFYVTDYFIWWLKNVERLRHFFCYCKKYVAIDELKQHFEFHNKSEFQCFHCTMSDGSIEKVRWHMINRHPDKLLFVAVRQYRTDRSAAAVIITKQFLKYMIVLTQKKRY